MDSQAFSEPFNHWELSDVVDPSLISAALSNLPSPTDPNWIRYENDCELHKWAMERNLPPAWAKLLDTLATVPVARLTGIPGLCCDMDRRGAGLHLSFPGGILRPHVDYALHPYGLERRANLILFLTDGDAGMGGTLDLCDPFGNVIKSIHPIANRGVIFECSDLSYHAVSRLSEKSAPRVTAASYFLAPPRPGTVRRRATFLPIR